MYLPFPKLRSGLRVLFLGAKTLLIVGGSRVFRISGTFTDDFARRLIREIDGVTKFMEILSRYPDFKHAQIIQFIQELDTAGLLIDGSQAQFDSNNMFFQFSERLNLPTICYNNFHPKKSTDWMDALVIDLEKRLFNMFVIDDGIAEITLDTSHDVSSISKNFTRAVSIKKYGLRIFIDASPKKIQIRIEFLRLDSNTLEHDLFIKTIVSLLRYWMELFSAGYTTVPSDVNLNLPALQFSTPSQKSDQFALCGFPEARAPHEINLLCFYAVGSSLREGKMTRIAPTAGGLNSIDLVCIVKTGKVNAKFNAFFWDENISELRPYISFRHLPPDIHQLFDQKTSALIILTSHLSRLIAKYGNLAHVLQFLDAGAAIDHIYRAAHSFSVNCRPVNSINCDVIADTLLLSRDFRSNSIVSALAIERNVEYSREIDARLGKKYPTINQMLCRRSVRDFSNNLVDPCLVSELEKYLFHHPADAWRDVDAEVILGRLLKIDEYFFEFTALSGSGSAQRNEIKVIDVGSIHHMLSQNNLSSCSLIYIVGFRRPSTMSVSSYSSAKDARAAGALLSTLWIGAYSFELAGTICGNLNMSELGIMDIYDYHSAGLCLGRK